jgi:hypothetical protein
MISPTSLGAPQTSVAARQDVPNPNNPRTIPKKEAGTRGNLCVRDMMFSYVAMEDVVRTIAPAHESHMYRNVRFCLG